MPTSCIRQFQEEFNNENDWISNWMSWKHFDLIEDNALLKLISFSLSLSLSIYIYIYIYICIYIVTFLFQFVWFYVDLSTLYSSPIGAGLILSICSINSLSPVRCQAIMWWDNYGYLTPCTLLAWIFHNFINTDSGNIMWHFLRNWNASCIWNKRIQNQENT